MNKISIKERFVLTVPANKPTTGAPVGPMIGQRGLSSIDFSKKVSEITSIFNDEVPCILNITVTKSKQFNVNLKGVPVGYLIQSILTSNRLEKRELSVKVLYLLSKYIHNINTSFNQYSDLKSTFKQIISAVKSQNINIIK